MRVVRGRSGAGGHNCLEVFVVLDMSFKRLGKCHVVSFFVILEAYTFFQYQNRPLLRFR